MVKNKKSYNNESKTDDEDEDDNFMAMKCRVKTIFPPKYADDGLQIMFNGLL